MVVMQLTDICKVWKNIVLETCLETAATHVTLCGLVRKHDTSLGLVFSHRQFLIHWGWWLVIVPHSLGLVVSHSSSFIGAGG